MGHKSQVGTSRKKKTAEFVVFPFTWLQVIYINIATLNQTELKEITNFLYLIVWLWKLWIMVAYDTWGQQLKNIYYSWSCRGDAGIPTKLT